MKNRISMILVSGILAGFNAQAAMVIDWKTDAADTVWATNTNWVLDTAPTSDLTTNIARFNQAAYLSLPNAGTTSIAGIEIGDGVTATAALTLSGTALTAGADGIKMFANAGAATISSPITLGAAQAWANNSANALTVSGIVSGSPSISFGGSGKIVLGSTSGNNEYSNTFGGVGGTATILSGTVQTSLNNAFGDASNKLLLTGGNLTVSTGSSRTFGYATEVNGSGFTFGEAGGRSLVFTHAAGVRFNGTSPQTLTVNTATSNRNITFQGGGMVLNQNLTVEGTARVQIQNGITVDASRTLTINQTDNTGVTGALVGSGFDLTLKGSSSKVFFGGGAGLAAAAVTGASSPRIVVDGPTVDCFSTSSSFSGGVKLVSGVLRVSALSGTPLGSGLLELTGGMVSNTGSGNGSSSATTLGGSFVFDGGNTAFSLNTNGGAHMTFSGSGELKNNPTITQSGPNTVKFGNIVTLTSNATLEGTTDVQFNGGLVLPGDRTLTINGSGIRTIAGALSSVQNLDLVGDSQNITLGLTTGSGTVIRLNDANARLNAGAASTFTSGVTMLAGTLRLTGDSNVGFTTSPVGLGTLTLLGGSLTINSASRTIENAVTLNGAVSTVASNDSNITLSGTTTVAGTSSLSSTLGTGAFFMTTVAQNAPFSISGNSAVTISNLNVSAAHQLDSTNSHGNGVTLGNIGGPGGLTIGSGYFRVGGTGSYAGGTNLNGGTTRILGNNALQTTSALTLGASAVLELNGYEQTVTSLSGNATSTIRNANMPAGAAAKLTVINSTANTYDGTFSDINGNKLALVKSGAASLTLSNASHNGLSLATIDQGLLTINGLITGGGGAVIVNNNGTLGGSGMIGTLTVNAGGAVAPGSSTGVLTATGNATFDTGSVFTVEINGTTAGTQYDQLSVGGATGLTLTGSVGLNASIGYAAAPTDKIWIANLTPKAAVVSGTFDGLAQGATVSLGTYGGQTYTAKISYNGNVGTGATTGTGQNFNDIVLYDFVATGGSPYDTWSGGAAFADDANGDGVDNGLAWMLGAGNPNANALGLLPVVGETGGGLTMHFKRVNPMAPAHLYLEYSYDLGLTDPWHSVDITTASGTVGGDIGVLVVPGSPTDDISLTIPAGHAAGGKLFGRLKGTED